MNSPSPETTATHQRCQYRTPAGRRCALHILDPRSSFCPRHVSAQIPDSQDFSTLIFKNAGDFADPGEIKHALVSLFKLLASGRITSRRAKALAYIASLVLRTLRDSGSADNQIEIRVEPRYRGRAPQGDRPQGDHPKDPVCGEPASSSLAPHSPGTPPTNSQSAAPASAAQSTTSELPPSRGIVSPSVYYGHPPIRPYNGSPPLRSCPLPARRPTRRFRAALPLTPPVSQGWKT